MHRTAYLSLTRKLRAGAGRGEHNKFLLCVPFCLDWDGSSAMGNHVKHIAQCVGAWLISEEEQLASIGVTGYWSHRASQGCWSKQCRALPLPQRAQNSAAQSNFVSVSQEEDTCVFWGDMYYCRLGGKSTPLLLLSEPYGKWLRHTEKGSHAPRSRSADSLSLLCSSLLHSKDLVPP